MSGLNSISGLNKVGVDYRPDVNYVDDTKGSTEAKDVQNGDVIVQNDDENVINIPNPIGGEEVGSLLQQLDVLLVNAAKRSVTTDAAQKTRNALNTVVGDKDAIGGDTLVDLGIITKDEAARLEALAKDATSKLKALDKFTGAEIALAIGSDKSANGKGLDWRKTVNGEMVAVAAAVKDAIDAQANLSKALYVINRRLARCDQVDGGLQDKFVEIQLQCDRRETEIYSLALRMRGLALQDIKNGGVTDPKIKELLKAQFQDLMPREAIMMHGTADAIEKMQEAIGKDIRPLAEKLDAYAKDHGKVIAKQELAELHAYLKTAKSAVNDVRENGIIIDGVKYDIDKSILQQMEEVLADADLKIEIAHLTYSRNVLDSFKDEVLATLLPDGSGKAKLEASSPDSPLGKYVAIAKEFVEELSSCSYGSMTADEFVALADDFVVRARETGIASHEVFMLKGYDESTAMKMLRTFMNLKVVAAQFAELKNSTDLMKDSGEATVTSGDVRRIMLGEIGVSSVVEAAARGFKAGDANTEADDANIVDSKPLGAGSAASAYLVTTKGGKQLVFKPELEGRVGLSYLTVGKYGAYSDRQKAVNLNFATQETAKMLGCEDMVVKYSVGSHNGQFGMFMEKAPGVSGHDFLYGIGTVNDGSIVPGRLAMEVVDKAERDNIKGQIARQLNRLQWLDIITGQSDRHWGNYFMHIDKKTHVVTLKAIDNDASYSIERIGVQKYRLSKRRSAIFRENLMAVCGEIHGRGHRMSESARCMKSPAITTNDDGTLTIDMANVGNIHEVGVALAETIGMHSIGIPDAIDKELYDRLIELDKKPEAKEAYLATIAPRLSPKAREAARMRLDDAIELAKKLADKNRVFDTADWKSPIKVSSLGKIRSEITIKNNSRAKVKLTPKTSNSVYNYLIYSCPSYYRRDFMGSIFDRK